MKGGKYAKTLAKIQVKGIFRIRDIWRDVLAKFIEICMETPCWGPSEWAPTWRTGNQQKHLLPSFAIRAWVYSSRRYLKKCSSQIYRDLYGDAMLGPIRMGTNMVDRKPTETSVTEFCYKSKSLETQAYSITKPRTLFEAKICMEISFELL